MKYMSWRPFVAGGMLAIGILGGCSSKGIQPMTFDGSAWPGISAYSVVTVMPFQAGPGVVVDPQLGAQMAEGIARRLRSDFGQVFAQVRTGTPAGQDNELVLLGEITECRTGQGPDGGSARLHGQIGLQDAADTQDIANARFDTLRETAGMPGQIRPLPELIADTEAAIAFTVARAKGWKPAGTP
jgi:hypothetical protein